VDQCKPLGGGHGVGGVIRGTPTESMVAREAVSGLLSALAASGPRYFIAHLTRRLNIASPESPAGSPLRTSTGPMFIRRTVFASV
jgi:hypothetical protein